MNTKTYIGTKTVITKPMTWAEYHEYRGCDMPIKENGVLDGYLVEYTDGGPPNDSRHLGYISWSPKGVFELSYKLAPVTYRDRLIAEHAHEAEKLSKLMAFMETDLFRQLALEKRIRLHRQASHMTGFVNVLKERIDAGD